MVTKSNRILRVASSILLVLMMVGGLATFYLERLFLTARPVTPSPEVGYAYPVEIKGKVVYLSRGEHALKLWLFPVSLLIGFAGGMLWIAADKKR